MSLLPPTGLEAAMAGRLRAAMIGPRLDARRWLALCAILPLASGALVGLASRSLGFAATWPSLVAMAVAGAAPWAWLRERGLRTRHEVMRNLPAFLDLVVLGLEAGCGIAVAMQDATARLSAGPLRGAMEDALGRMRAGMERSEALSQVAARLRVGSLTAVLGAIRQAETTGISLAPLIRAQSQRCLQERFALAERRAMEAPVRMLLPLVLFIFPCTFIVIAFPLAVELRYGMSG